MDEHARTTGPADGRLADYHFGPLHGTRHFDVQATSLARAIRLFRVGVLFPHQYAEGRIATPDVDEKGWSRDIYLSSAPGSTIPVFVRMDHGWIEAARIPPEGGDIDPRTLALLGNETPGTETITALTPAGTQTGLQNASRVDLEARTLDLTRQMAALAETKRQLESRLAEMNAELKRRMEQIWIIELFLGSKEEVVQIRDGAPAPADTPIAVRQQVLCMDEEIALWEWTHHPDRIGTFDFKRLDDFDAWLTSDPAHLDTICPWPKGVVGLRVRRKARDRDHLKRNQDGSLNIAGVFEAVRAEENDRMTYLLVRNGERLYRLWVDVDLWPRLFASTRDAEDASRKSSNGLTSFDTRDARHRMKNQVAGLVALQGLIERSELLHPLPRPGLNVFDTSCAEHFLLVRDHEDQHALADASNRLAHVTWKDVYRKEPNPEWREGMWDSDRVRTVKVQEGYETWLHRQFKPGIRVIWLGTARDRWGKEYALERRTDNRRVGQWPKPGEAFTLDSWADYSGYFRYLPNDEVYLRPGDPDFEHHWQGRPRRRRVSFRAYYDELLPIDVVSWRVLEHLLHDRSQREHYAGFFGFAFRWWKLAKEEAERERPFIDLVLHRAGDRLDDTRARSRCERLLRWWKLKVQEHRTLGTDDAKALRMVETAYRRGDDADNDPEMLLFRQ